MKSENQKKAGLFWIPVVILMVTIVSSCSMKEKELNNEPLTLAEVMPEFPGGFPALMTFIKENVNFPESARIAGTQGKVIIKFCVTEKGKVDRVSVEKGISPDLDEEALRVVQKLPAFEPGTVKGKPVSVWYQLPITFALN